MRGCKGREGGRFEGEERREGEEAVVERVGLEGTKRVRGGWMDGEREEEGESVQGWEENKREEKGRTCLDGRKPERGGGEEEQGRSQVCEREYFILDGQRGRKFP